MPKSVESFEIGDGFPDQNEFRMKFGVACLFDRKDCMIMYSYDLICTLFHVESTLDKTVRGWINMACWCMLHIQTDSTQYLKRKLENWK